MKQRTIRRTRNRTQDAQRTLRLGLKAALASLLAATLILPLVPAHEAQAAEPLVFALIEIAKDAHPAATEDAVTPGENVVFDIDVSCSSTQTDCVSMKVADAMPAPLVLVDVSASPFYTTVITGNAFELTFTSPLDEGGIGLRAGELVSIVVTAMVPLNADASFDGQTVVNTAFVTVDNPESNVQDDAAVLLDIPLDLASTITKAVTPASVAGFPDTVVTFAVAATNSSNSVVDTLVIQDPAEPASNAFDYLEVTGLTAVVFPAGANRVQVDWYDGATWVTGSPVATATLPVAPALIKGLRLTFSNSSAATDIAVGATGSFSITTKTTSAVSGIVADFHGTNLASSQVWFGVDSNTPVLASAPFTIRKTSIAPGAAKDFEPNAIIGGQPVTVTVRGTNGGDFSLSRMTITEPKTGTTSLADQGIAFDEWVLGASGIEWPTGATAATASYLYEVGGWAPALATTAVDSLPGPDPAIDPLTFSGAILGFTVTFTGTMPQGAYAELPYTATTATVSEAELNLTNTNTIEVEVETVGGATALAEAADALTRRSSRVNTTVRKIITPAVIYAVPGASALLSLPAEIAALPPATPDSTVGATIFTVRDDDADFWSRFNAISVIATDVPATSTMTVRYRDAGVLDGNDPGAWVDLPGGVDIVGPDSVTIGIPAGLRDGIAGLEFVFVPTNPADTLPPGFTVQPNIRVALRELLRGTSTPVMDPLALDPVDIINTVVSEVQNPVATPPFADDSADDSIRLLPVGVDGPGLIDKFWHVDTVRARSSDTARLSISWGTGGLPYDSVVITDTAIDPAAGSWNVADTVFEAFDLRQIPAISPAMDPLLQYDAIESVELYLEGSGWVPTATNPCAGTACYGTFPGYTLTATERATALGVRFVVIENPNRPAPAASNPSAPEIGSGVAVSVMADRDIDLDFAVRDTRRSDGTAVLGASRGAMYNTAIAGRVLNDAYVAGLDVDGNVIDDDTASDTIDIIDRPLDVQATKVWRDGPVGVPPVGTLQEYFPEAEMVVTAQNTSVVRVNELSLAEPTGGTTPFEYFTLTDLVAISTPTGATASTVTLSRGAVTTDYTIAQALALGAVDLADVTGFEVVHTGRIYAAALTSVTLRTQLREFERTAPLVRVSPRTVDNTVTATVTDPAGTSNPPTGTDNVVTAIASANIAIEAWNYSVIGTKSIEAGTLANVGSPAIQYDESSTTAKITLTGQPAGNVRTTKLVFEDANPSFWNAYNFDSFGPGDAGPASPAQQVRVDALVGVTYAVDGSNAITSTCAGLPSLEDCWVTGIAAPTLALPAGVPAADVRGLRFTYTRIDGSNWERPNNPIQSVVFTVERRTTLIEKTPSAVTSAVPSTQFDFATPAPGETVRGTYTNTMSVIGSGGPVNDPAPLWWDMATDVKQILFQHLPARVEIKKTPLGLQSLGADIPYQIVVTNRGGEHERELGTLVVTDLIPTDGLGPQLVIPNDPDTGMPYPLAQAFTYTLKNAANAVQAAPTVDATFVQLTPTTPTYRFALVSPTTLPKGWTLTINATMQLRPMLETGIAVTNTATVTADQRFDSCDSWTVIAGSLTQKAQQLDVLECVADTTVAALASAPMTIVKGVRGVDAGPLHDGLPAGSGEVAGDPIMESPGDPYDDLGILKTVAASSVDCTGPNVATGVTNEYYRFPCVPITRPGGIEEWAATFTNGGNIPVTRIAAIDVLPRVNDRGVIVNESRSSKWTPTLTNLPTLIGAPVGATLTVKYVTANGIATTRCNAADIQTELGMSATSSPAITALSCLDNNASDDVDQRTWTTLTQAAIDADPTLLASVVALKFVVDLDVADYLAPGEKISIIYRSRTAAAPEIGEAATGLDRESIAYNSIAGAALGLDGVDPVANRFVIEPRKVGVAMAMGGLELEKLVAGANSGASYLQDDYLVTLSCTSAGESFVIKNSSGVSRNPFTITRGAAATLIQGLPLYADCTVGEADYGSVQSFSPATVTAQAGLTSDYLVYDPNPAFGAANRPAIQRSTVTNTYNLAGFTVNKVINDGGAVNASGTPIAYDNFVFSVACTFFNGVSTVNLPLTPSTFTLTAAAPSRSYTGLPAGAVCTVTETTTRSSASSSVVATGGTGITMTNTSTVAPVVTQPSATMTLAANDGLGASVNDFEFTNNFGVGSLIVNKTIAGAGAALYGGGTFTVNVSCTRRISSNTALNVWNGQLTFDRDDVLTRTISNIATGAVCTISEPGQAGATTVGITSGTTATIPLGAPITRTVTNTFNLAQLVVTKRVLTSAADQDPNPVILDTTFDISVGCTFLGQPVYATGYSALSPMEATVTDGVPWTLTGLPANAACVVTESAPTYSESTDILFYRATHNPAGLVSTNVNTLVSGSLTLTSDASGAARNWVDVQNNYGVASFTVTKEILGAGIDQFDAGLPYADESFTVHVECIAPNGGTAYDDDIVLTRAVPTVTISTIAADSTCTAVESNYAATGANAVVYRHGTGTGMIIAEGTVIDLATETGLVTIQNWYHTGSVEVTKTVGGAAASTFGDGPFEVTLTCTLDGTNDGIDNALPVAVLDPVREILGGETETFTRLPAGAECVIAETDTGGATSSFIVRDGSLAKQLDVATGYGFLIDDIADDELIEADQAQAGFDIQNDFEFASLSVTKTVDSDAVNQDGDAINYGPFPVSVDCVFNGDSVYANSYSLNGTEVDPAGFGPDGAGGTAPMQLDLAEDDVWLLRNLPEGATCTVTETDSKDAVDPYIVTVEGSDPQAETAPGDVSAVLTLATTNSAAIVNPYAVGSLELSKALAGDGAATWADGEFTVRVDCTLSDATGIRNVWLEDYTFERIAGSVFPESVLIQDLASDALCTITEVRTGGANATEIDVDGTITAGTEATATITASTTPQPVVVTNTFDLSEINVNKVITGAGAVLYGDGPFEVTLTCTREVNGDTVSVDVPGGATRWLRKDSLPVAYFANYSGLPLGAECTMVESQIGGASIPGVVVEAGVGAEGPFTLAAIPSEVTVTNFFGDPTVVVRKLFAGSTSAQALYGAGPFEVRLDCTREVNGTVIRVPIPHAASATDPTDDPYRILDAANGYTAQFDFLPSNASCELTETGTGGSTGSVVSSGDYVIAPDGSFQLGADGTTGAIDVTNTFEFANLRLTKQVVGTDAGANIAKVFEVELGCELEANGIRREVEIPDGASRTISHGEEVQWADLPAGADCTVTETSSGGAAMAVLTYNGLPVIGSTVTLASGDSTAILANVFLLALTGVEPVLGILVGGQLVLVGLVLLVAGTRRRRGIRRA